MRILIIDDDVALCRSMQIQLEAEGHAVDYVHNGADGLARLASAAPDILFLDLNLPDMTGIQVLKRIQGSRCEPVVIMITGVQDAKATIDAVRHGAFDYIRKPIVRNELFRLLRKYL